MLSRWAKGFDLRNRASLDGRPCGRPSLRACSMPALMRSRRIIALELAEDGKRGRSAWSCRAAVRSVRQTRRQKSED